MCRKLCHFFVVHIGHMSKIFEGMKAGKFAIWSWLSCLYNKNTLVIFYNTKLKMSI